jgi:hypothetical protein
VWRLLAAVALLLAWPSTTRADDQSWGITIWGLSYHTDRDADYNELNWGLGLRYYHRPEWKWLGTSGDNRVFLEGDALRDSNRGLMIPISAGVEYRIAPLPAGCKLFAVGAFTVAYYRYATRDSAVIKFGPVPGVVIGCGRLKTNVEVILRPSSSPLAALTASWTIVF